MGTVTLQDILIIEDDASLLDFRCPETGFLLWPMVRQQFLRCIVSDLVYKTAPLYSTEGVTNYRHALTVLPRAFLHNLRHISESKAQVLMLASGVGLFSKEGRLFNRLSDYFALAAPARTTVVEDFFKWRWPFPRHNHRVLLHAPMQALYSAAGHMHAGRRQRVVADALIAHVRRRAKGLLDWELGNARAASLVNSATKYAAQCPFKRRAYRQVLAALGAQVVIKEEACYGHSGVFNATAREMGITTVEYQHGTINAGHDAYNFAPSLLASDDYRKCLPEYFLGYGAWWHEQINAPVSKVVIGNPHRSEQIVNLELQAAHKCDLLILGDGIETDLHLDLAGRLAEIPGLGLRVVFRPHPLERDKVLGKMRSGQNPRVSIDRNPNIYDSFNAAHAVVSETSTGLFEAVGLVKRIFIWDTPKAKFYYPRYPFASFGNAVELVEEIMDEEVGAVDAGLADRFWAPNWRANYLKFLASHGVV